MLDGAALAEAVKRILVLWPMEVDPPLVPSQPLRPNLPQGGWFEAILGPGSHR